MDTETPGVSISTTPAAAPQVPPASYPQDSKLKELLSDLTRRLDTLNASVLEGNTKADSQKADIKKLADLIMEDTAIGFEDFKKKIVSQNIPAQIESKGLGLTGLINLFVPNICGDISELLGLKRDAEKQHGDKKTE